MIDGIAARYLVNGLLATGIHYAVLWMGLDVLHMRSAGLANFLAAVVASTASFLGNRYLVFRGQGGSLGRQAGSFAVVYLLAALFHGAFLHLWTDVAGWPYPLGFLVGTSIQVVLVYALNRRVVFA